MRELIQFIWNSIIVCVMFALFIIWIFSFKIIGLWALLLFGIVFSPGWLMLVQTPKGLRFMESST